MNRGSNMNWDSPSLVHLMLYVLCSTKLNVAKPARKSHLCYKISLSASCKLLLASALFSHPPTQTIKGYHWHTLYSCCKDYWKLDLHEHSIGFYNFLSMFVLYFFRLSNFSMAYLIPRKRNSRPLKKWRLSLCNWVYSCYEVPKGVLLFLKQYQSNISPEVHKVYRDGKKKNMMSRSAFQNTVKMKGSLM